MYFETIQRFLAGEMKAKDFSDYLMQNFHITSDGEINIDAPGLSALGDTGKRLQIIDKDVLKLCDAVLSLNIHPYCLISFGAMVNTMPEFFIKVETDYRAHIVTNEWGEHGYHEIEMNLENVLAWKEYILTGINKVKWKYSYN